MVILGVNGAAALWQSQTGRVWEDRTAQTASPRSTRATLSRVDPVTVKRSWSRTVEAQCAVLHSVKALGVLVGVVEELSLPSPERRRRGGKRQGREVEGGFPPDI